MPFLTIKDSFHLCGQSAKEHPTGFQPDGDSMQFKPDDASLLDRLDKTADAYRLTSIGSTQLRFEGIDALELHFEGHHQPRPLADDSRDYLTGLLGMNPSALLAAEERDRQAARRPRRHARLHPLTGTRSARTTSGVRIRRRPSEPQRRFRDAARAASEEEPQLQVARGRQRLPAYYDTLFASLRATFTTAAEHVRAAKKGLWKDDLSTEGLAATSAADLEAHGVVFPKLYRRLTSYFDGGATSLMGNALQRKYR
jgi:hypothetical protein